MPDAVPVLPWKQRAAKRAFDLSVAGAGFILTLPVSAAAVVAATIDTREFGVFSQRRIGRYGKAIQVHKVRSMRTSVTHATTVTTGDDPRITRVGAKLRRFKLDELPQLYDVILGNMSLVGPRPDVEGYADRLTGADRVVLSVRPGITGPASIAYRHEEQMLASQDDPDTYNRQVIWPDKVRINRDYVQSWTLRGDLRFIMQTIRSIFEHEASAPERTGNV